MSRENVAASLEAVEQALSHLARGLESGGFEAGAPTYRQLAGVVLVQWLWAEQEGARELEPDFERIALVAAKIAAQLEPYVEAMRQLAALEGLIAERRGERPEA